MTKSYISFIYFTCQESTHSIKIVQPTGLLTSIEDTACLRSLVSYAIHIPTENPVTIVSK